MKKILMKSDKTLETINFIKSIIDTLNKSIESPFSSDDLERSKERLSFMKEQLVQEEARYESLKNNDSPYYEDGSIQYYKEKFCKLRYSELDSSFTREVIYCIKSERMKNKLNAIKNIVKAYNTREEELYQMK